MIQNTLKVSDLCISYSSKNTVVDKFNFQFEPGLIYGLLGPSGCGKTTLIRALAGLEKPTLGSIVYGDEEWGTYTPIKSKELPCEKRNVGFVFQNYALWPHLTVFQNVAFPLECRKVSRSEVQKKVSQVLSTTEILDLSGRLPSQLSGGQSQRVALARALVIDPKILFLDEPFSALDANLRAGLRGELKSLHKRWGGTVILVSHDWADVEHLCHRVLVLDKGKTVQVGTPDELKKNPANAFVSKLVFG